MRVLNCRLRKYKVHVLETTNIIIIRPEDRYAQKPTPCLYSRGKKFRFNHKLPHYSCPALRSKRSCADLACIIGEQCMSNVTSNSWAVTELAYINWQHHPTPRLPGAYVTQSQWAIPYPQQLTSQAQGSYLPVPGIGVCLCLLFPRVLLRIPLPLPPTKLGL